MFKLDLTEIYSKIDKIPTPLLLIYLVLAPILTTILSNPNIDITMALYSSIIIISGIIIISVVFLIFDNQEKERIHNEKKIALENQKLIYDYQAKINVPMVEGLSTGTLDVNTLKTLLEFSNKLRAQQQK